MTLQRRQRRASPTDPLCTGAGAAPAANRTGLPDGLKAGVERLSGQSMDDVRVHYGSSAPASLDALAYARGSEIHLGPSQERHLPHEAWHVAQQKQGRVRPTFQMRAGTPVNDDAGLEREADAMGLRALAEGSRDDRRAPAPAKAPPSFASAPLQAVWVKKKQSTARTSAANSISPRTRAKRARSTPRR